MPFEKTSASPASDESSSRLDAESDIDYRYLTFATTLPVVNTTLSSAADGAVREAPPAPNLKPYENPMTWPDSRKNLLLVLSCISTFFSAYAAGVYAPPADLIAASLHTTHTVVLTGITTFCLGFALAPMVLAPFSEINGRYPIFAVSGIVFVIFQLVCGFAPNVPAMLIARFFAGVGASVFSSMVGGVIADIWSSSERNTPMAVYSGTVLVGTGAGPLIGGAISQRLGIDQPGDKWKWVFWHQVIGSGLLVLALIILWSESRGNVLLSRKGRALNKYYESLENAGYFGVWDQATEVVDSGARGLFSSTSTSSLSGAEGLATPAERSDEEKVINVESTRRHPAPPAFSPRGLRRVRWRVKSDEERGSVGKMVALAVYRPFHMLTTEPVVFFFSLWAAFAWAVLYLTFASVAVIFEEAYGMTLEQGCRVFIAMIVGSCIATTIGVLHDRLLRLPGWQPESTASDPFWVYVRRRFPSQAPESRLYFTCFTAALLPIGLFMFGFTARSSVHWIVPSLAIGIATMGIYSVYLAVFNYIADVYHMYASSALAAQSFCRNVLGGVFPIVAGYLVRNLGNAGAGGLLGGIAVALTLVPWVLVFFGERIRARSKLAKSLEKT